MKTKIILIALAIQLLACKHSQQESMPSVTPLKIYQPSILTPIKGTQIPTTEGIYEVQTEGEVWHSDKRYRLIERRNYTK